MMKYYDFDTIDKMSSFDYLKFINNEDKFKISKIGDMSLKLMNLKTELMEDDFNYDECFSVVDIRPELIENSFFNGIDISFDIEGLNFRGHNGNIIKEISSSGSYILLKYNSNTKVALISPVVLICATNKFYNTMGIYDTNFWISRYPISIPGNMIYISSRFRRDTYDNIDYVKQFNNRKLGNKIFTRLNDIKKNIEEYLVKKSIFERI